ncbi:MAG: amidohydrolase family protein, partial [Oscillospiraceae bacterium]
MKANKILIENSRIITENKILEGYSLVIQDGIIKQITEKENYNKNGFVVIDAKGQYLSPGFLDIHNHGNSGSDAMDATQEAIEAMSRFHLSRGVTGFLATTMTNSHINTVNAIKNAVVCAENGVCKGAQLLGLYLEGPYFCMEKKGAQPPDDIKDPDIEEIRQFIELGKGLIKVVALAPELKGAIEAISLLKSNGIAVSCGHS